MTIAALAAESLHGQPAPLFELRSSAGFTARISAAGGRLVTLAYPDGTDVVVGPEKLDDFTGPDLYAGALCGRVANRISHAAFMLDGTRHHLLVNRGDLQLHGGPDGFHNRVWACDVRGDSLLLTLASPAGDQGYPGTLHVTATYALTGSTLSCVMEATTDAPTIVNLTNHVYWNLAGGGPVGEHTLQMEADRYCVAEAALVTGELRDCAGSAFDFRSARKLNEAFAAVPEGIDHNFCLTGERGRLRLAGVLEHPASGRRMELSTSECGLQIYTANHFGEGSHGKNAKLPGRHHAIAMEPQAWPDAPNRAGFPSIVLRPGEVYTHGMEWKFS